MPPRDGTDRVLALLAGRHRAWLGPKRWTFTGVKIASSSVKKSQESKGSGIAIVDTAVAVVVLVAATVVNTTVEGVELAKVREVTAVVCAVVTVVRVLVMAVVATVVVKPPGTPSLAVASSAEDSVR